MRIYLWKVWEARHLKRHWVSVGLVELVFPRRFPFPWPKEWRR